MSGSSDEVSYWPFFVLAASMVFVAAAIAAFRIHAFFALMLAAMLAALIGDGAALPYHPLWMYLAIGFGSMMISWMNDSGFWVVCKLSGCSERETPRTWTLSLAVISLVGLAVIAILSRLLPDHSVAFLASGFSELSVPRCIGQSAP